MAEHVVNPQILHATANPELIGENENGTSVVRVRIRGAQNVNLHSVQSLVDFLDGDTHQVTELELEYCALLRPSDGGLDVLIDFFANQTTLAKVKLWYCDFGSSQEVSQLIAAVQSNRLVTDLTIYRIEGAAFGNCLSALLQNNTSLQRLKLGWLNPEVIRGFQPALRANRNLKKLDLSGSGRWMEDQGIRLIADALVGNTTMEVLDISNNDISSNGLDDITRLLELTQLKDIDMRYHIGVFNDEAATQRFAHVLSRHEIVQRLSICLAPLSSAVNIFRALESNTMLEEMHVGQFSSHPEQCISRLIESLPRMKGLKRLHLDDQDLKLYLLKHASLIPALDQNTSLEELLPLDSAPWHHSPQYKAVIVAAKNLLARNRDMRRADLLMALQPQTGRPIGTKSGLWYKAFGKFSSGLDNGASAIFKILHTRPAIFEIQLRRPSAPNTSVRPGESSTQRPRQQEAPDNKHGSDSSSIALESAAAGPQKRQRRS